MKIRLLLLSILSGLCLAGNQVLAECVALQDIPCSPESSLPTTTIFMARKVVTLDPERPEASAVAVVGDRILAAGTLDELKAAVGEQPYEVDSTFADKVIIPGLIAQHDHPLLSGLTMSSEIIAIEDWVLPSGTVPAARSPQAYRERLVAADAKLADPDETLVTWGYHPLFHGRLTRADLDQVSSSRPIIVWHRSAHEFIFNTAALDMLGLDAAVISAMPASAQQQTSLEEGHFWEAGMLAALPRILPAIATPERIRNGLQFVVRYYHANGVTLGSEPGGFYSRALQDAQNAVLSAPGNPFRYYYIPDGRAIYTAFPDTAITETEKTLGWGQGMTSIMPKRIKLFADGAVYSQFMQLRESYTDGHHGEWMMEPAAFAEAFRIYWDADYQMHVHVTGDAGLDMVLDTLETNMRRHPRYDHRTVIIHFAVAQKDQVERIRRLGAIVSGNPYYVTALADMYGEHGLGPERADNMVRTGDVERAGISYSYHADMPMAPGRPLYLIHTAVNRTTVSGRVAGADQRNTREGALKAVTLEAAYSLGLEKEVGSIEPGKLANFTILADDPLTVPAARISDIAIWGTVHEGRKLPVAHRDVAHAAPGPVPEYTAYPTADMSAYLREMPIDVVGDMCDLNGHLVAAIGRGD